MPQYIPLSSEPRFRVPDITLDGKTLVFEFNWNDANEMWYFNIYDADENPIVLGCGVVSGIDLLKPYTDSKLPKGKLVAGDVTDINLYPTQENFGTDFVMIYVEEDYGQ